MPSQNSKDVPNVLPFDARKHGPQKGDASVGYRFDGKVALITGASDRGIGGAVAERLAREGARIAIVGIEKPTRLVKQIDRIGSDIHLCECDVRSADDVRRAVDDCVAKLERIDVVVNNAGLEAPAAFEELPEGEWNAMLDVNLNGAIRVAQTALSHLEATRGVIVNVSSALGLGGCSGFSIYSASKAGMIGFTQSLAMELAPRGVRVVAVAPALVDTETIHKQIRQLSGRGKDLFAAVQPLGMGNRHDVAAAVAFLASPEARWITGVTLPLGWSQAYPLPTGELLNGAA